MLSLKSRVFTSGVMKKSSTTSTNVTSTKWGIKRNEERLQKAYEAVRDKKMTLRQASEIFGVAKSTLHDLLSGKVLFGSHSGPPRLLTQNEEEALVTFLVHCASVGYPRSRKDVLVIVQGVLDKKGYSGIVSHGWWESFRKQHPNITIRKAEALSNPRYVCVTPEVINNYFDLLEETLIDNDLMEKPCQIFNCDESGFPLDPPALSVIAQRGQKHPYSVSGGDKTQITVLVCCSAGGYVIPPFIVFDRKNLKPQMTEDEIPGTMYGLSDKGWMDKELFELWFINHFLVYAPPARPLLLLLDGHSSHYSPSIIDKATEEGIVMFCLPPYSSHLTQPLDRCCFAALKRFWREECFNFKRNNPHENISRFSFCKVFHKAWKRAMSMSNITASFRVSGVYPVDRGAVLPKVPSTPEAKLTIMKKAGVSFVPSYNPFPQRESMISNFTKEEMVKFERRYEEKYDLTDDPRYNLWLQMYHPQSPLSPACSIGRNQSPIHSRTPSPTYSPSSPSSSSVNVLPFSTVMDKVLNTRQPRIKMPNQQAKTSARVLTSFEQRKALQEKEDRKREEEER